MLAKVRKSGAGTKSIDWWGETVGSSLSPLDPYSAAKCPRSFYTWHASLLRSGLCSGLRFPPGCRLPKSASAKPRWGLAGWVPPCVVWRGEMHIADITRAYCQPCQEGTTWGSSGGVGKNLDGIYWLF